MVVEASAKEASAQRVAVAVLEKAVAVGSRASGSGPSGCSRTSEGQGNRLADKVRRPAPDPEKR